MVVIRKKWVHHPLIPIRWAIQEPVSAIALRRVHAIAYMTMSRSYREESVGNMPTILFLVLGGRYWGGILWSLELRPLVVMTLTGTRVLLRVVPG